MTISINFAPQTEAWINSEAQQRGMLPEDLIRHVLDKQAASAAGAVQVTHAIDAENAAAIAMLKQWIEEDATDDLEEIRKVDEEVEELRQAMNANRAATGERLVFS